MFFAAWNFMLDFCNVLSIRLFPYLLDFYICKKQIISAYLKIVSQDYKYLDRPLSVIMQSQQITENGIELYQTFLYFSLPSTLNKSHWQLFSIVYSILGKLIMPPSATWIAPLNSSTCIVKHKLTSYLK